MKDEALLVRDDYHVWLPIEDTELLKSVTVDENGDYIVQGVMTSDDTDEEDDSITPNGMDCTYFLEKGWVKYEHGNNPNQFIGEPLEVRVGQFEHPTLKKSVNGIFVKSRLFANRELTQQAVKALQDLQKSNTKRCMGWSIEGNVKERDRKTGKIVKSVLRNVVLTMNPVNTMTWAELSKSFAKNHELTADMEKAMDIEGAQAIATQSLEGKPKEDEQKKFIEALRALAKEGFLNKSIRQAFKENDDYVAEEVAYNIALRKGFSYTEAVEFAKYAGANVSALNALVSKSIGGERMGDLAKILDAELEELNKALLEEEEDDEEFELEKSMGDDEEEDDEDDSEGDDDDYEDEDEDDEEEEEEVQKSLRTNLSKSLAEEHGQAFEVSDFLTSLTDEIGFGLEGMEKSLTLVTSQNVAIVKSLASVTEVIRDMAIRMEELQSQNTELEKSLTEVLNAPVGRKSVVNNRDVQTLNKSVGSQQPATLNRMQTMDVLMKSFEAGEISGSVIPRFEAGVSLDALNLPAGVKAKLGL